MKFRILLLLLLTLSMICGFETSAQTWTKVNGTNYFINKIFMPKGSQSTVVVASDGIPTNLQDATIDFPRFGVAQYGLQISNDSGKTFGPAILSGFSVYDIWQSIENNDFWFASVRQITDGMISFSTDKGNTWQENELMCIESSQIMSVATKQDDTADVYLMSAVNTNKGAKYSTNGFYNCSTIDLLDLQARDVKVSPLNSNLMFFGGDNSLHGVYFSTNGGSNWTGAESGLDGLRILCLLPSSYDAKIVYCGADSIDYVTKESRGKGIYQSIDGGKNWKRIAAHGLRVFAIAQHPLYPKFLAAACDSGGVFVSGTFGWGWEQFKSGFSDTASVRQIAIPAWDSTAQGFLAFAGVFGDGLWMTKNRLKTNIDENSSSDNSLLSIDLLYPNPADNIVSINWTNAQEGNFTCRLVDALGRTMQNIDLGFNAKGNHYLKLELSGIVPGIYTIVVSDGHHTSRRKVSSL